MKAIELYFPVVLFIMLYKVVPVTFESVDKILLNGVTVQMKSAEQYFAAVLFIVPRDSKFGFCG